MREALGIRNQAAGVVTPTNPAVVNVEVNVAQIPPPVLSQSVSHLQEEPFTSKGRREVLLSRPKTKPLLSAEAGPR